MYRSTLACTDLVLGVLFFIFKKSFAGRGYVILESLLPLPRTYVTSFLSF